MQYNVSVGIGQAWDVLPRAGFSAGTPFTRASLGGEVRVGWNMPADYGSSSIRPGSGISCPLEESVAGAVAHERSGTFCGCFSIYAFFGVEGHFVAYNSFLDGNMEKHGPSVDKFPLAGDLNFGLAMNIYDFQIAYTHVYRAKECHGQDQGRNFGSITLGHTFWRML